MRAAFGIDLGGTELRAALVGETGAVLAHAQTKTAADAGPEAIVRQIEALVGAIKAAAADVIPVGVGIGAPGPLDTSRGLVQSPPTLRGWTDVPLAAILSERLGLPAVLDNDGHAAALGEWAFGAAIGAEDFVYITVSTGIGGGVVCDGRLLRGRGGRAGHVGHMIVTEADVLCNCGNRGCWEALASGPALAAAAQAALSLHPDSLIKAIAGEGPIDARMVGSAARKGDELALRLVRREAEILGAGIASLIHLFSPECVILGGGLSALFDLMQPTIEAAIAARAMPAFRDTRLVKAALGDRTGVVGAASLVLSRHADRTGPLNKTPSRIDQ
jgi:glucokinase